MTREEFRESLAKKGYHEKLIEAAYEHAASISIKPETLVGDYMKYAEMIEMVAVVSFIEGFGFCADGVYPKIKDKL